MLKYHIAWTITVFQSKNSSDDSAIIYVFFLIFDLNNLIIIIVFAFIMNHHIIFDKIKWWKYGLIHICILLERVPYCSFYVIIDIPFMVHTNTKY